MDVLFSKKVNSSTFRIVRLGYAEVDGLSLTLRRADFSEASFKLDKDHPLAGLLTVSGTYVDLYRDGSCVFRGRIAEPLTHGPDWVEIVAYDEWWWLTHEYRETSARLSLTSDHLKGMIEADAGDDAPRIDTTYMSFASGGPTSAVVLEAGTSKLDDAKRIIETFRYEAGFVPYYDVPASLDAWGMFPIAFYPGGVLENDPPLTPVTDREQVRFEYGEGTIANLLDYKRDTLLPTNRVVAFGPGEGEARETVAAGDADSLAEFGKVATTATFEEAVDLDHDAKTRLIPDPPKVYAVTVGPDAPMLWDDFYVGDYCRLRVRDGAVDDNVSVRVDAVTIVAEDDTERIASVVLMTEDAILQASGGLSGVSPTVDVTFAEFQALTPADGDRVRITDVNNWVFQYDAEEATAYKWKFVSGDPISASVASLSTDANSPNWDMSVSTSNWSSPPWWGPELTVPLAGVFLCTFESDAGSFSDEGHIGAADGTDVFKGTVFAQATLPAEGGSGSSHGGSSASHTFARGAIYRLGYNTIGDVTLYESPTITAIPQKVSQD